MKRALYSGQRVHTRFWNEVTVRRFNRGESNPLIRTATIRSVGGGRVTLNIDPTDDPDQLADLRDTPYAGAYSITVPANHVHRGEPDHGPDPALVQRHEFTWRRPSSLQWDYRLSLASFEGMPFREWLRRTRDNQLRWTDAEAGRQALRERVSQRVS